MGHRYNNDHSLRGFYNPAFADQTGKSALRKASRNNPRDQSCPTCKTPNILTRADAARGYQCDSCADKAESGFGQY